MSGTDLPTEAERAAVLFSRLRALALEASTVTAAEDARGRLLMAVLVATGASAGSIALIDGQDVQVFSASGYTPELIAELGRFPLNASLPLAEAARTGEIVVIAHSRGEERFPLLGSLGLGPAAAVPLSTAVGRIGALGLSFAAPRRFDQADLAFFDAVGAQVATVIDRIAKEIDSRRLLDRDRAAERVVRASLLPARVPVVRGWEIAARYQAAAGDLSGDFYDFIPLPTGGWAVVIGDVQGRGPEAAIVGALARQALRDSTATFDSPAAMLAHLNGAMLEGLGAAPVMEGEPGLDASRFVTVAAVTLTPAGTARRIIRLALAGHPQPLHGRASTGRVVPVGSPGGLLGLLHAPDLIDTAAEVSPGDVLVLFTDGLVERHHGSRFFDEGAVAALIVANLQRSSEEMADALIAAAQEFSGPGHSDDTAVVVLRAR